MGKKQELIDFVCDKVKELYGQKDTSSGKRNLAILRRGIGKKPGEVPELWSIFLEDKDDKHQKIFRIDCDYITHEEWASYIALTLYALHQQSQDILMHQKNMRLGYAARKLAMDPDTNKIDENRQGRVFKRLNRIAQTRDIEGIAYQLRSFVTLLSRQSIPLDYGLLAADLYDLQDQNKASIVCLNWGRQFYKSQNKDKKGGKKK